MKITKTFFSALSKNNQGPLARITLNSGFAQKVIRPYFGVHIACET